MAYSYEARFESFRQSLAALREAKQRDRTDSFVLSGTSAKFSITFELAWKVMKDVLVGYYGVNDFVTGSPRETLRTAAKLELISDDRWMDMLDLRNLLAHDYDLSTVTAAYDIIVTTYVDLFGEFENKIASLGATATNDSAR